RQLVAVAHAERGRVYQEVGFDKDFAKRVEPGRRDPFAKAVLELDRPFLRAVGDTDIADAGLFQRVDYGAGRAASANPDGAVCLAPLGRELIEVSGKAIHIGIAATDMAVLEPQRIDRTGRLSRFVAIADADEGCLLVRDRDIAAGKTRFR